MKVAAVPWNAFFWYSFTPHLAQRNDLIERDTFYLDHYEHDEIEHSSSLFQLLIFVTFDVYSGKLTIRDDRYLFTLPNGKYAIGLPFHVNLFEPAPGMAYCSLKRSLPFSGVYISCYCNKVIIPKELNPYLDFLFYQTPMVNGYYELTINKKINFISFLWNSHLVGKVSYRIPYSDTNSYRIASSWQFLELPERDELSDLCMRSEESWCLALV